MLDKLITDRTAADVARFLYLRDKGTKANSSEKTEWYGNLKGAYNASDLNRVGNALNFVRDRLIDTGYLKPDTFVAKTDWAVGAIPTAAEFSSYLGHVATIREALAQFEDTPPTPADTGALDYIEANNIERILLDIDQIINHMLAARHFCGELYAGEA